MNFIAQHAKMEYSRYHLGYHYEKRQIIRTQLCYLTVYHRYFINRDQLEEHGSQRVKHFNYSLSIAHSTPTLANTLVITQQCGLIVQ